MKKKFAVFLILCLLLPSALADTLVTNGGVSLDEMQLAHNTNDESVPKVYFLSDISPEALVKAYRALNVELNGRVGGKMSTGESTRSTCLRPELIAALVHLLNGTIVECNTAYGSDPGNEQDERNTSANHWKVIARYGFTPLI